MQPAVLSVQRVMDETITTVALADLLGISTRTIRDYVKRGIAVRASKDPAWW